MTVQKLASIVANVIAEVGYAKRIDVKRRYGLGFEGAIRAATQQNVVLSDLQEQYLELTERGRRMVRNAFAIDDAR